MIRTVTMNSRNQQIRKHNSSSGAVFSVVNGLPASKRPRVCSSGNVKQFSNSFTPQRLGSDYDSGVNTTSSQNFNDDLFADDDFTGEELAELELVASQAENATKARFDLGKGDGCYNNKHHNLATKSFSFKEPHNSAMGSKKISKPNEDSSDDLKKMNRECKELKLKVEELQKQINQKGGETSLLRDKLNTVEKTLHDERQRKTEDAHKLKQEKTQKELDLEKRIENYRDQMEFQHAELKEAQSIIKNMERKNEALIKESNLVKAAKNERFLSQNLSQVEDSKHKKIKFVKPESPRIPLKKSKLMKSVPEASKSAVSKTTSQEAVKLTMLKRKNCKLHTPITPASKDILFDHLSSLCRLLEEIKLGNLGGLNEQIIDKQLCFDCVDGIEQTLLASNDTKKATYAYPVIQFVQHCLQHCDSKAQRKESQTLCRKLIAVGTLLEALLQLFKMSPCVCQSALVQHPALVSLIDSQLTKDEPREDEVTLALGILTILAKTASGSTTEKLLSNPSGLLPHLSNPLTRNRVMEYLLCLTSHWVNVERLIKTQQNTSDSFFSRFCAITSLDAAKPRSSVAFLSKVITLLTSLTADYEDLLIKYECFADVYKVVNVILFHQLNEWETCDGKTQDRNAFVSQSVCLLHSCSNIFLDGIPGVHRDHQHLIVLFQLRRFLDALQPPTFWSGELRKILEAEIESIESPPT